MCEEGWCVGLGQEGVAWGLGGGTVWNTLKGVEQKRREGKQRFKKGGGEARSRGACPKKGEAGIPL